MPKLPEISRERLPKPQMQTFQVSDAKSGIWSFMPGPVATLSYIIAAGSVTGLAYFLGDRFGDGKGYLWSLIAIGGMTVIVAVAAFIASRRNSKAAKEKAAGFEQSLKNAAGGWDSSVQDVAEIARLDDLRGKFQEGIQIFHDYGKDLYELPWYVIVGEPGSGKSEAIRHSELRFPQGLQDKLQGVGGTYSMNWWFTNNAVLLDTAGAMLTQPEASERFGEFLRLLREHRADFPINGLILTLPVDKLLTDPPHVAEEKARGIAQQLSIIQKALDVRFPLYLVITKSDRLPGFREFFDAEGQDTFELQMVGWSNPDPVGTPFDPSRVHEAVDAVVARLNARALALLADPIPRMEGRRRMDEVDSIYSFPETIRSLKPRLQCYLDSIFQTGAWAVKAPFFRGLYFTSALREGAQIDQALAQALNVDVHKLPSGGIFTQDKAVFLRDLFLSKIFPERGLVTRLRDIGALLRRRLLIYYGTALGLLLIALLLTLIVRDSLTRQLAKEQDAWLRANATWNNGTLLSPLSRHSAGLAAAPSWSWVDQGDPLQRLDEILKSSSVRLHYAWVFSPLAEWREFERRRREAGLSLYEASVMKPLLDAARERVRWDTAENAVRSKDSEERLSRAYCQLAKLEGWVGASGGAKASPVDEAVWHGFFQDLLSYVLAASPEAVSGNAQRLTALTLKTYGAQVALPSRSWLAERETDRAYSALHHAGSMLFGMTAARALDDEDHRAEFARNRQALRQSFEDAEKRALEMSRESSRYTRAQVASDCLQPMREAVKNLDFLMAKERGGAASTLNFKEIAEAARTTQEVLNALGPGADTVLRDFSSQVQRLGGTGENGSAASVDDDTKWSSARGRLEKYEKHFSPISLDDAAFPRHDMVGNLKNKLQGALGYAARFTAPPPAPAAAGTPAVESDEAAICRFLDAYRGVTLVEGVLKEYESQLQVDLSVRLIFPFVNTKVSQGNLYAFHQDCNVLTKIEADAADLGSMADPNLGVPERDTLLEYFARLRPVFDIRKTLDGSGVPGRTDGLFIRVDGAQAAEIRPVQTTETHTSGFFGQNKTEESHTSQVQLPGIKSITISVGGRQQQALLNGQYSVAGYDGFGSVTIVVARTGAIADDKFEFHAGDHWDLLRRAVGSRSNKFVIGGAGIGFTLESSPPLPFAKWPKRSDFGFPE